MIDRHLKLPCGADLIVAQGTDKTYMLMHLISNVPLDKFLRVDFVKNALTVSIDPDNIPVFYNLFAQAQPLTKFQRILRILREKSWPIQL